VVDLQRVRVSRLADRIAPVLAVGHVFARTADLHSVDDWRAAARRAGRNGGWRIRTGTTRDAKCVWAVREDLEPSDQQRRESKGLLDHVVAVSKQRWHP
jgi:hypothetical protein